MSELVKRLRDPYIVGCVGVQEPLLEAADALEAQAKRITELEANLADSNEAQAKRMAELEGALRTALSALNDGFHAGFCSGKKCQICDNYKSAMEVAKNALEPDRLEIQKTR